MQATRARERTVIAAATSTGNRRPAAFLYRDTKKMVRLRRFEVFWITSLLARAAPSAHGRPRAPQLLLSTPSLTALGAGLTSTGTSRQALVTAPSCGVNPAPYTLYWNVGGGNFTHMDVSAWGFAPGNSTQTGGACSQANCSAWSGGLWPSIGPSGEISNGGVPQAGNLTAHLEYISTHIDAWLPDPLWSGNAVFDFENWTPIWEENTSSDWYHSEQYQNLSMAVVAATHPTWNESQISSQAKLEFEAAALAYFVDSLELCTSLRPHAAWGFYGFPDNPYGPCVSAGVNPQCGYRNPLVGPLLRAINDQLSPIYAASTGVFPSIYMPAGTNSSFWAFMNADYVSGTTEEATRLVQTYHKGSPLPPVRPFAWAFYHDAVATLLPEDLVSELQNPLAAGADGVILWGAPDAFNHAATFLTYLSTTLGPLALNITTTQCECAQSECSGHGACVGNASAPKCRCYPGYSGTTCSTGTMT